MPREKGQEDCRVLYVPQAALFSNPELAGDYLRCIDHTLAMSQRWPNGSTKTHGRGQRKALGSLDRANALDWTTTAREKEEMFFLDMEDSLFKAEVA